MFKTLIDALRRWWGWKPETDELDELSDKTWAELYGDPLWGREDEPSGLGDIDSGWPDD